MLPRSGLSRGRFPRFEPHGPGEGEGSETGNEAMSARNFVSHTDTEAKPAQNESLSHTE